MKKAITILLIFILSTAFLNAKPHLNSKNNNQYEFKSLINPKVVDDSLITRHARRFKENDNKNFFSINLFPILLQGASNLIDNKNLFSNQKTSYQLIQFQFFYERKITPKSSIEFVFSKKNPVNTSLQEYITFGAQNPYGEILGMKSSESYMGGLFYKIYFVKGFYFSPGFIYRNTWFNNQMVRWGNPSHSGRVYHDRADVKRQDIGLRLLLGYKFKFKVMGNKSIFFDCYSGFEIQKRDITINHYEFHTMGGGGGSFNNPALGIENVSDWSLAPQIGIKFGYGW